MLWLMCTEDSSHLTSKSPPLIGPCKLGFVCSLPKKLFQQGGVCDLQGSCIWGSKDWFQTMICRLEQNWGWARGWGGVVLLSCSAEGLESSMNSNWVVLLCVWTKTKVNKKTPTTPPMMYLAPQETNKCRAFGTRGCQKWWNQPIYLFLEQGTKAIEKLESSSAR